MQTVKYRKPIPVYVLVILGLLIAGILLAFLAYAGIIDLAFIGDGLVALVTVPYLWAGASWVNGLTFTIGGVLIIGVIFLMIAKRKYLIAQKALVVSAAQPYVPRGADLSTSPPTPAPIIEEPKTEAATA